MYGLHMTNILTIKREAGAFANVLQGVIAGVGLTVLSYVVGIQADWIDKVDLLEAFAVFTSYVCTYLCVMERRINYPIGAISTVAYCVLFYRFDLNASAAINAFLSVYLLYGWLRWKSDDDTRPITRMNGPGWLLHIGPAMIGYAIVVFLTEKFGGALAWTDSVIFAGTILAQLMLDNKKLENWLVWIGVNCFAIYTYFNADLFLVGFQYIFFLANAFFAFGVWLKSYRKQKYNEEWEDAWGAFDNMGPIGWKN